MLGGRDRKRKAIEHARAAVTETRVLDGDPAAAAADANLRHAPQYGVGAIRFEFQMFP